MSNLMRLRPLIPTTQQSSSSKFRRGVIPCKGLLLLEAPAAQEASSARPKKMVHPLGKAVIEGRLHGAVETAAGSMYSSSGSEHELSSVCLAAMVDEFLENEERSRCINCSDGACAREANRSLNTHECRPNLSGENLNALRDLVRPVSNIEMSLVTEVAKVISEHPEIKSCEGGKRLVMKYLRNGGYNAGLCKSRWSFSGVFPQGDYEYIDVLLDGRHSESERIIIDIDFRAQFEIARPTSHYLLLLQTTPLYFVGKADRLQQIVNIMIDSLKHSLKKQGLLLPPWRKSGYLMAKWFSSYKRTTNCVWCLSESAKTAEFSGIAMRNFGMNAKHNTELEMYDDLSDKMRKSEDMDWIAKKTERSEMEKSKSKLESRRNGITTLSTEWTLPTVNTRSVSRPVMVGGLRSVLMQTGSNEPIKV